jgi:hypothetical protein
MLAPIFRHTLWYNNALTIIAYSLCAIIPKVDYKKQHQAKRVQIFRRLRYNFGLSDNLIDIEVSTAVRFFAQGTADLAINS